MAPRSVYLRFPIDSRAILSRSFPALLHPLILACVGDFFYMPLAPVPLAT